MNVLTDQYILWRDVSLETISVNNTEHNIVFNRSIKTIVSDCYQQCFDSQNILTVLILPLTTLDDRHFGILQRCFQQMKTFRRLCISGIIYNFSI